MPDEGDNGNIEGLDPAALAKAVAADLPMRFGPQLASSADTPPRGENWLHEIKFDGYRTRRVPMQRWISGLECLKACLRFDFCGNRMAAVYRLGLSELNAE